MLNKRKTALISALFCALSFSVSVAAVAATNFKIAVSGGKTGGQYVVAEEFAKQLEKMTNGEYTATLYPNSQLGGELSTIGDTGMGLLDFTVVATNNIAPFSPGLGILSLPYLIKEDDEAMALTQSDFMKDVLIPQTIEDAGVRLIAWDYTGFRAITNSKHAVTNLDDLRKLKMRVPKSAILLDLWSSWGINPVPMDWDEVYTALQQKVVDGQALPLYEVYSEKLYENQEYLSKAHYNYLLQPLIMSEEVYQSLPANIQEIIHEAGVLASKKNKAFLEEQTAGAEQKLLEYGVKIEQNMDESEMERLATEIVWPKYHEEFGEENINAILEVLGRTP